MVPGAAKAPDLAGKGDPVSEGPLLDVARNRSESSSACKEGYRLVDGFWPLTGVQPSQRLELEAGEDWAPSKACSAFFPLY